MFQIITERPVSLVGFIHYEGGKVGKTKADDGCCSTDIERSWSLLHLDLAP